MKDLVKEIKFERLDHDFFNYRKFMCSKCIFFTDEVCTKNRNPRNCAKKGLKNRA